jgi:hypothetical protein
MRSGSSNGDYAVFDRHHLNAMLGLLFTLSTAAFGRVLHLRAATTRYAGGTLGPLLRMWPALPRRQEPALTGRPFTLGLLPPPAYLSCAAAWWIRHYADYGTRVHAAAVSKRHCQRSDRHHRRLATITTPVSTAYHDVIQRSGPRSRLPATARMRL